MGIREKINNAKKSDWIVRDIPEEEVKTIADLTRISVQIEKARLKLGMTQKEFADYMGVTQAMVSKWESREYNFTVKTLNEIFSKLNVQLKIGFSYAHLGLYKAEPWIGTKMLHEKRKKGLYISCDEVKAS